MMFKILLSALFGQMTLSQPVPTGPVGGELDIQGCMIGAGYSWCAATNSCMRMWENPCPDNYDGCSDCLKRQRNGENIACPTECDIIDSGFTRPVEPPHPVDPLPTYHPPPPYPPPPYPIGTACPDVMCMMYCENGFVTDDGGCNTCSCITIQPHGTHDIVTDQVGECPIPYSICSNDYVCPKVTELTHCSQDGISGYTTYRLSLVITNPHIQNIYAIYGDSQPELHPMSFPPAYQGRSIGDTNIGGISEPIVGVDGDAAYDSWLTIGITEGDIHNELSSVGIDFQSWTETTGIYTTNGAVFTMNADGVTVTKPEYVVAQITISDDQKEDIILNAQGKLNCDNCDKTSVWTENDITFHLEKPDIANPNIIPTNCASWYDGCNTCSVINGNIGGCTMMMCFRQGNPYCQSFNIEPPSGH